ncbi:SGNH/GDSL hydrolase family protein [[Mycoplasma] mobile]|uniref:p65 lipoprotein-like protein n=1 Tax=Mycoplasma mobile (strain ATCC 43663 / 163K / NCTC 11711) TaxID=267748 RepID=Q6KHL9_MYCM1|nr:SGNH/GDSL hydrolase family protein [[Mycoplasma] mobile]AAT27911.1 P65 lipoprotein-like protein [Mycoplasma mobile 163K]
MKKKKKFLSTTISAISLVGIIPTVVIACSSNVKTSSDQTFDIELNEIGKTLTYNDFININKEIPHTLKSYFTFKNSTNQVIKDKDIELEIITNPSRSSLDTNIELKIKIDNQEITKLINVNNSSKLINAQSPLKILSIGDSVSAGYNAQYSFDLPGKFNQETKEISGLSYGSFLVQYIQSINEDFVSSFDNFALSGSTIKNWLYLLSPNRYDEFYNENLKENFFYNEKRDKTNNNNPQLDRLNENFPNWKNDPLLMNKKLINKLEESNLITLTLGANDFFDSTFFDELQKIILGISSKNLNISDLKKLLDKTQKEIQTNLIKIFTELRKTNKNASIEVISYPAPLLKLLPFIDSIFEKLNLKEFSSDFLLSSLNNSIKLAVNNFNSLTQNKTEKRINFLDVYDEVFWKENTNKVAANIFDIHSSTFGYQKIAQEIVLKLALPKYNFDSYDSLKLSSESDILGKLDETFFKRNYDSYFQEFEFEILEPETNKQHQSSKYIEEFLKIIFENSETKLFDEKNKLISQNHQYILNSNQSILTLQELFSEFISIDSNSIRLKEFFKSFFNSNKSVLNDLFGSDNEKLLDEVFKNLNSLIFNENNFEDFISKLIKSDLFVEILSSFQVFSNENNTPLTEDVISSFFIKTFTKSEILWLAIKTISETDLLKEVNLLNDIISGFVDLLYSSKASKELITGYLKSLTGLAIEPLEKVIFDTDSQELIKILFSKLLENPKILIAANSFSDILNKVFDFSDSKLVKSIKSIFKNVFDNIYFSSLIEIELNLLLEDSIQLELNEEQRNIFKDFIKEMLNSLISEESSFFENENPILKYLKNNFINITNGDFQNFADFILQKENLVYLLNYFSNALEKNSNLHISFEKIIDLFIEDPSLRKLLKNYIVTENTLNSLTSLIFSSIKVNEKTDVQNQKMKIFVKESLDAIFNSSQIFTLENPLIKFLKKNLTDLLRNDFSSFQDFFNDSTNLNSFLFDVTNLIKNNPKLEEALKDVIDMFINDENLFISLTSFLKDIALKPSNLFLMSSKLKEFLVLENLNENDEIVLNQMIEQLMKALFENKEILVATEPLIQLFKNNIFNFLAGKIDISILKSEVSSYFASNGINLIFKLSTSIEKGTIQGNTLGQFINLLFEKSRLDSPLYTTLKNKENFSSSTAIDLSNLFNLQSQLKTIVNSVAKSLYASYLDFSKQNTLSSITENPYYSALYRFSTTLLLIGRYSTNASLFWNFTNLSASATIIDGLRLSKIPGLIDLVNKHIVGSDSFSFTSNSNFEKNQILWYLYYYDSSEGIKPSGAYAKFFGQISYIDVLINSLKNGNLENYIVFLPEKEFELSQELNIKNTTYLSRNTNWGSFYYSYYLVNKTKIANDFTILYDVSDDTNVIINEKLEKHTWENTQKWINAWKVDLGINDQNIKTLKIHLSLLNNGKEILIKTMEINGREYQTNIRILGFKSFS